MSSTGFLYNEQSIQHVIQCNFKKWVLLISAGDFSCRNYTCMLSLSLIILSPPTTSSFWRFWTVLSPVYERRTKGAQWVCCTGNTRLWAHKDSCDRVHNTTEGMRSNCSLLTQVTQSRVLRAVSHQILNIFKGGDSTTPLDNLREPHLQVNLLNLALCSYQIYLY